MSTAQLNDNSHSATSFSHPPLARYPFHQQAARTWTSASPFPLLTYGVDSYSSVSSGFKPEYIMFDRQDDPGSRWTGLMSGAQPLNPSTPAAGKASAPVAASTSTSPFSPLDQFFPPPVPSESQADPLFPEDRQWICIQLDRLALVDTITFGKTNKPHPCNTKEVDVFYSTDKQHWVHGLRASLKNNTEYETFKLKNPSGGQVRGALSKFMMFDCESHAGARARTIPRSCLVGTSRSSPSRLIPSTTTLRYGQRDSADECYGSRVH